MPNLKYPANPPSVGQPDTIGIRTGLYFGMVALSITAMTVAAMVRKRLVARLGAWEAATVAAACYVVVVVAAAAILPPIDEVPPDFPAVVLWSFRVDAFAMQAIMWTVLGLSFGALTERSFIAQGRYRPRSNSQFAWR